MRDFRLAAGYRADLLAAWCESPGRPEGVAVNCIDTGELTETGGASRRSQTSCRAAVRST